MTDPKVIKVIELLTAKANKLIWQLCFESYCCSVGTTSILVDKDATMALVPLQELDLSDSQASTLPALKLSPLSREFNTPDTYDLRVALLSAAKAARRTQIEHIYDQVMNDLSAR